MSVHRGHQEAAAMTVAEIPSIAVKARRYSGPIFDADTHLYETPDAFTRYMPKALEERWGREIQGRHDDGQVRPLRRPPQGRDQRRLHDRGLQDFRRRASCMGGCGRKKEGKSEVDMRVPISAEMTGPAERVKIWTAGTCAQASSIAAISSARSAISMNPSRPTPCSTPITDGCWTTGNSPMATGYSPALC